MMDRRSTLKEVLKLCGMIVGSWHIAVKLTDRDGKREQYTSILRQGIS